MRSILIFFAGCLVACSAAAQKLSVRTVTEQNLPLANTTVELLRKDSSLLKMQMTDSLGAAYFTNAEGGRLLRISRIGYATQLVEKIADDRMSITMQATTNAMAGVTVSARKPFVELQSGKTVINVESTITSAGATAMEALEKMPGITIDKDGNISLKGRSNVMVMIDGKPTYLDNAQLATLLNGMTAAQISQVELMDSPPAKYDAAGNAGVINIRLKKNRQQGFNGTVGTAYGQGVYYKNNNSVQLNFRSGRWNLFGNYSANFNRNFTRLYALRTYYENDGRTVASLLEQPGLMRNQGNTHNLRAGAEYSWNANTSLGFTVSRLSLGRHNTGSNRALWMDAQQHTDSLVRTANTNNSSWHNAGFSLSFRHTLKPGRDLSADVDGIGYRIRGNQYFENMALLPLSYTERSRADIPSDIHIFSARTDYSQQFKNGKIEGGWKTSHITTDNAATYQYSDGASWKEDLDRSNHFLYVENIHAFYASAQAKRGRFDWQGGLRYERTAYDAHQLGNTIAKDSAFSRKYGSLFPSFSVSLEADSSNTFSFTAGRRIDRPAFQKLNPFLFIINKYTYQRGNPFYRPQYTWNFAINHNYKNVLLTGISYSDTKDYFAQIFPIDTNGIVIYSEGNLGSMKVLSLSMGVQANPAPWWSLSTQAVLSLNRMEGLLDKVYRANITQLNLNVNNQFRFRKGWSAELSGFYNTKGQHDILEVVNPFGQISAGVAKALWKNKATLKLAGRDIFYSRWSGLTQFTNASEYFDVTRDSRTVTLSFTYRFGKAFKTTKRSQGAAGDEIQRVGNG